jgi:hypothetical protein
VTIAELRAAKYAEPFQRFRLRLADGRELLVRHPDALAWEGRTVVCVGTDRHDIIDLGQIADLVVEPAGGQAEGGGK